MLDKAMEPVTPLGKFIKNAATEFRANEAIRGLVKGYFELEFSFSVSEQGAVGVDFVWLNKVGVVGEISYGNELLHKLNLKFKVNEGIKKKEHKTVQG